MQSLTYDLTLPPPAGSLERIEEMQSKGVQPDIQELVEFLEHDPITVVHLLRQVNSPEYSLHQSVASLDRAVTMLGFDSICNTVFVETYTRKKEGWDSDEALKAYAYIVRIGIASAELAKQLARHLKMPDSSTVMTAALIHQMGRMALLSSEPVSYPSLWRHDDSKMSVPPGIGREIVHYRTDYMRYGAELSRRWQFPPELTETIRYHSDPDRAENVDRSIVAVVAVSQLKARSMYESEKDLNRDQGAERVESAMRELAKAFTVSRREIEGVLDEVKSLAVKKAESVKLFPLGT